jgi:hypothetical protein
MILPVLATASVLVQPADATCPHHGGAETVTFEQLPGPIQVDLWMRAPHLSPAGGPFNATDVGEGPRTRFLASARLDSRYVVAYEHGGRGYHVDLLAYDARDLLPAPKSRVVIYDKPNCETLDAALAAPLPEHPPTGTSW